MKSKSLDLKSFLPKLQSYVEKLKRYSLVIFIVFVASVYSIILFRISTLKNSEPSPTEVSSQVEAARVPHIDERVIQQLKSLQDNSVSVKALFDQARSNPFQ